MYCTVHLYVHILYCTYEHLAIVYICMRVHVRMCEINTCLNSNNLYKTNTVQVITYNNYKI